MALYAGSLGAVMGKGLVPAFEGATGVRVEGEGHGSVAAARMIRDRLRTPDVFLSADPAVNVSILMGPQNNHLVEWYLTFAAADLVIGYNPTSRFSGDFARARAGTGSWYEVLQRPGLKFGRTDPNLDILLAAGADPQDIDVFPKVGIALRASTPSLDGEP
jgi:molybdate/tungstate transport system substrate-binding protein